MPSTLVRPSPPRVARAQRPRPAVPPPRRARRQAAWLALGFALAFTIPFVFADTLELNRDLYYGLYAAAVAAFVAAWARDSRFGRSTLTRNWRWGVALGAGAAAALVAVVLRTEDATGRPEGLRFVGAILWRGVLYGATDGVLLSVFPILAVFAALPGLRRRRAGTIGVGALALVASLAMTAVYHVGYSDFRSEKLRKPVAGDVVWSAPTLFTLSPLGAPIAHAGLHVAAVVHSYDTDTFLPPHRSSAGYSRPDLQRKLDAFVTGPQRIAPGAVAYVSGPRGTWSGAAGLSNVARGREMTTDARMRLESVSKIYTATIVHQLAAEGKLSLDDTLEKWLPGLIPYGDEVTVSQLLTHTSGIPDDNVVSARFRDYLVLIEDPAFRSELLRLEKRYVADPALELSPEIWVRIAAAVPPRFRPGTNYEYSNTGFLLLGRVAEQATGTDIATLYERRIFRPLGLVRSAWDPQGPIAGPHASGYRVGPDGRLLDATDWHTAKGADGAVVADAEETARFLVALMKERFFGPLQLARMQHGGFWSGGNTLGCGADAYGHAGAGAGFKTEALVSGDGQRVAVLLLNGRGDQTDAAADNAIAELFCST
jgi:D-alanyl-D-alanine carboxypeptidase